MLDRLTSWCVRRPAPIVAALVLTFVGQIALSIGLNSQTFDESVHLFAGYQYWQQRDFGANPEHPPLLKLVAAAPLLVHRLEGAPVVAGPTKSAHNVRASAFLYHNVVAAPRLLFEARMAASIFVCVLLVLVFAAGREMFGVSTGLVAAALVAFDPSLLANGPLITTDAALTTCLFAAVYAAYRHAARPSATRLALFAIATACAFASKHSAVLLAAILPILMLGELVVTGGLNGSAARRATRRAFELVVVGAIVLAGLWAIYTFRFQARPAGADLGPPLPAYIATLKSGAQMAAIRFAAKWHLLPESYLWGLTDVFVATEGRPTFILGRVYAEGQWFYFPLVFGMKTTLAVLGLLLLCPLAGVRRLRLTPQTGDVDWPRIVWFLTVPPIVWLAFSMLSGLNIGFRHILPVVPFVTLAAAASAVALSRRSAALRAAVALAVVWHAGSSLSAFPNYLTYSNELVGGPRHTYQVMTDSNADWGQGLVQAASYISVRGIGECWFANRMPHVDLRDVGIPCRPLQAGIRSRVAPEHPAIVEGTLFVSANEVNGQAWGPGELNPYGFLADRTPDALIANSILVFHGRFDLSLAAASNRVRRAQQLLADRHVDDALVQARDALSTAPQSAEVQAMMCQVTLASGRKDEARPFCEEALRIADRVEPEYQYLRVPSVRAVRAISRPSAGDIN